MRGRVRLIGARIRNLGVGQRGMEIIWRSQVLEQSMQEITWSAIVSLLPRDLSALGKSTGAIKRWRKVKDGAPLLWLCFLYVQGFSSLRVVAGLSVGIGELKESSVAHRLRNAPPFLEEVLGRLLDCTVGRCSKAGRAHVLRIIDATTLSGPGSVGADFRLHAVYVPGVGLASVELTDNKAAESLTRGQNGPGDIVLGDQGRTPRECIMYAS